ncbi:MAG: phage tail sheath subtilisin-like domain-containing protein [Candidatus Gastranaerophilales bacterium]|nr:phage tail sheath subtilisin-like domain-containing protein [Candidatus Gastranaerophilales bacterium]
MSSNYLHGVETQEKDVQKLSIVDADLSNIVVIGTMPVYQIDDPQTINKITSYNNQSLIGYNIDGFTIPDAVKTILDESGGASIYTINVFDNDEHTETVTKTLEFTDGECYLDETGVQNLVLTKDDTELTLDTDYSFDDITGLITALEGGAIEDDQSDIQASYKYVDFTKITDSDIIGQDDNGTRTGAQAIYDIIGEYGITPGIIIVPGFSSVNIRNAITTIAEDIKAFAYFDAPEGTSVSLIEKARLKETDGIDLTETSERCMIFAPYVKRYNSYMDTTTLKPVSPVIAGLRVKLDYKRSVSKSIDNTETSTITGLEYPVSFILNKTGTDSNRINSIGIGTIINYKGTYYIWGSRNCSYPNSTGIKTFECARRALDYVELSIQNSSFSVVGEPITKGLIDNIVATINAKFDSWASADDPIVLDGEAWYDSQLNDTSDLADGWLKISYKCCPPSPVERLTYYGYVDIQIITETLSQ